MFCPKCGNELKENAKFCTKCGNKIKVKTKTSSEPVLTEEREKKEPVYNAEQEHNGKRIERLSRETSVPGMPDMPEKPKKKTGIQKQSNVGNSKTPILIAIVIVVAGIAIFAGKMFIGGKTENVENNGKTQQAMLSEMPEGEDAGELEETEGKAVNSDTQGKVIEGVSEAPTEAEKSAESKVSESDNEKKVPDSEQRYSGWYHEPGGWRFYNGDGSYQAEGWFEDADHRWYYFDEEGYMMTDTLTPDGFRLGTDGAMIAETQAQPASANVPPVNDSVNENEARTTDGFVIPDSSSRYITSDDVQGLSEWEARVARNEIYARHGRRFNSDELQQYFDSQSWYKGTVSANAFNDSVLSAIEKANVKTIESYEKRF